MKPETTTHVAWSENADLIRRSLAQSNILKHGPIRMDKYRNSLLITSPTATIEWITSEYIPIKQSSWGQHGAHLGPVGPRWTLCWPHEPCYQGSYYKYKFNIHNGHNIRFVSEMYLACWCVFYYICFCIYIYIWKIWCNLRSKRFVFISQVVCYINFFYIGIYDIFALLSKSPVDQLHWWVYLSGIRNRKWKVLIQILLGCQMLKTHWFYRLNANPVFFGISLPKM